ncbi:MAG: SpoIIE family protein phosphatase [Calditrichaeota bacterium]|nr:SpoIIE family protein phosphatase [Calditrichota bacterium]
MKVRLLASQEKEITRSLWKIISSNLQIYSLMNAVLDLFQEIYPYKKAAIFILCRMKKVIEYEVTRGYSREAYVSLKEIVAPRIQQEFEKHGLEPLIVNRNLVATKGTTLEADSILVVPLVHSEQLIGFIMIELEQPGSIDHKTLEFLGFLGLQVSVSIENARLYRQIQRESLEKTLLLEVAKKISSSIELDEVLNLIIDSVRQVIPYDAAGIFLTDKKGNIHPEILRGYDAEAVKKADLKVGRGLIGVVAKSGRGLIINNVLKEKRYIIARKETRSELIAPLYWRRKIIGVLNIESDKENAFVESDLSLLEALAGHAAIAIENARLHQRLMEQQMLEREMRLAREIQKTLLPKRLPRVPGYEFSAVNLPSRLVSGDFYDIARLKKGDISICIGDVSGKGAPAALMMASLYSAFKSRINENWTVDRLVARLNRILYEHTLPGKYATFFLAELNPKEKILEFCNAGHNPPILITQTGRIKFLETGGTVLGFVKNPPYRREKIRLKSGDLLFFYTDGLIEASNPKGEFFEMALLLDILITKHNLGAYQIRKAILKAVSNFTQKDYLEDDLTIIVVKIH